MKCVDTLSKKQVEDFTERFANLMTDMARAKMCPHCVFHLSSVIMLQVVEILGHMDDPETLAELFMEALAKVHGGCVVVVSSDEDGHTMFAANDDEPVTKH